MPEPLQEVAQLSEWKRDRQSEALIGVDGGIDTQTAPLAAKAGAEVFVAASAIFEHAKGIVAGIQAIRRSLVTDEIQGTSGIDNG